MLDQAKHMYNLGGGKRSFGNVNLPTTLPSSQLPKNSEKPSNQRIQVSKTQEIQKSKARDLMDSRPTGEILELESQKSYEQPHRRT